MLDVKTRVCGSYSDLTWGSDLEEEKIILFLAIYIVTSSNSIVLTVLRQSIFFFNQSFSIKSMFPPAILFPNRTNNQLQREDSDLIEHELDRGAVVFVDRTVVNVVDYRHLC